MCIETKLGITGSISMCLYGWPLLAPLYRWPGLEDPVGFDTDPSYMIVYNTTSLFDYDYTLASILGLLFYGPLPEQSLGVLIQRALVVIPLLVAPDILSESPIRVKSQIFKSSNLWLVWSSTGSVFDFFTCSFYQYLIRSHFYGDFGERAWCFWWIRNSLIARVNTRYLLQTRVPGLKFGSWRNPACAAFRT
jgi:hypothetical protein